MKPNLINTTDNCRRLRWPFPRHSTAWLPTITTNLHSILGRDAFHRVTNFFANRWGRGGTRPYQDQGFITRMFLGMLTLCLLGGLLTAQGQDPRITIPSYPMDTNVSVGATVRFQVFANTTNPPITRQWQHEGTNLPGATNIILLITNVTAAHAGGYRALITNGSGNSTNTRTAILTVDPTFTKIMTGPIVAGKESGWAGSWADYDDDGDIDLLVGNGVESSGLERMGLFRNDGPAGFVRLTNEVGSLVSELGRFAGGVWADYDNDGALDCIVTDWTSASSTLALYRNLGNATFQRQTAPPLARGIPGYLSWVDYDNDGWLDVFDAMAWSDGGVPTNALFHASGSGVFTSVKTGILVTDRFVGLEAAAWGDYDGDGDQDLLATDFHAWWRNHSVYPNHFYRNDGGGVFTRTTNNAIALDRTSSLVPAWADYDNDGRLDVFLTSYSETSRLFHNDGDGQFTKILMGPGLETGQPAWGDFDNDGDLDLYISRGQGTATTNLFYRNNGDGTFSSITAGSPANEVARSGSCIWGDYDNDGFLDLFVANNRGEADFLYHNNGNGNQWLMVKLVGTASNRSAIGAKVRAYAKVQGRFQWRLRDIQGGNRCQNDPRAHFGLGDATSVDEVRIEWPSGIVQRLYNVAAGQFLTVTETANTPPVAAINVSPLAVFPGVTDLVVIAPNAHSTEVVLDGSISSDVDNDPLEYWWTDGITPIATGMTTTQVLGIGSHPITLVVSDGLATGTNSVTVEVVTPAQSVGILMALVEESELSRQRQRPLLATLNAAAASFERGNLVSGINQLHAFQNKVEAQVERLDAVLADQLTDAAQVIIDALMSDRSAERPPKAETTVRNRQNSSRIAE